MAGIVTGTWLLSLALLWAFGALPGAGEARPEGLPAALFIATAAAASCLFVAFGAARGLLQNGAAWATLAVTSVAVLIAFPLRRVPELGDGAYLARHTAGVTSFRGLDALRACLGDAIHVYHSEVGVTGLRFPNGRVTDLVGLLSPRWLFRESSFDALCKAERPEAIFLPHKSYRGLNREIAGSDCIRGYARVIEHSSSPLFVRRDQLERYRRCAGSTASSYSTAVISSSSSPRGVRTITPSPTRRPSSARASGATNAMLPCAASASSTPTMR
jgi:hypothetical protein